jgi:hypothetical protein
MKNGVFWDVMRVALVRTDVSEELSVSLIFLRSVPLLLVTANVVSSSPIHATLMKRSYVPPKRRFLQGPRGVTSQKTQFFTINLLFVFHFAIPDRKTGPLNQPRIHINIMINSSKIWCKTVRWLANKYLEMIGRKMPFLKLMCGIYS